MRPTDEGRPERPKARDRAQPGPAVIHRKRIRRLESRRYYTIQYYSDECGIDRIPEIPYDEPMIKGIKFVNIPVADQDRALAFYTEKLGFRIQTDQPFNENQRWIELSIPGADTGVTLFTPDEHKNRIGTFSGISFLTDDVERTYDELAARGVEFPAPPTKQPWGTFAMFKDPDGNQFVVSSR